MMDISSNVVEIIAQFEGYRPTPYLDINNVPTIGYGTTYYPDGRKVTMTDKTVTKGQAKDLLLTTLAHYKDVVLKAVDAPITQNQLDACVSLCYNIGEGSFKKSTLVKLFNLGRPKTEVAAEFMHWNHDNGIVVNGLTLRRNAERTLFLTP